MQNTLVLNLPKSVCQKKELISTTSEVSSVQPLLRERREDLVLELPVFVEMCFSGLNARDERRNVALRFPGAGKLPAAASHLEYSGALRARERASERATATVNMTVAQQSVIVFHSGQSGTRCSSVFKSDGPICELD